jgi:molybdenum cofactor synthesis domain-containing protein
MSESPKIRIAILTCSDRCSRGDAVDVSGQELSRVAKEKLGAEIVATEILPDDQSRISQRLKSWATESPRPDLILTTGGTGLSPRDVTPEATAAVLQRRHPALLELGRLRCLPKTPRAFLSRGEAGTLEWTLIINLPGSPKGAVELLEALYDILPHAIAVLKDRNEEH